jgi:hypothetical protein
MRARTHRPSRRAATRRLSASGLVLALLATFSVAHPADWAHAAPAERAATLDVAAARPGGDVLVVPERELCGLCLAVGQARTAVPVHAVSRVLRSEPASWRLAPPRLRPARSATLLVGHPTRAPPSQG